MTLPDGQTTFDRVVMSVGEPLRAALDRETTGYGAIVPQAGLLGDGAGTGVIWFEDGIPIGARHTGTGRTGSEALADIAETGPYRVRLVAAEVPQSLGPAAELAPGAPAEQVAGDSDLAARTREAATREGPVGDAGELDAVEAFLADEEKIDAIQRQAAVEARKRAAEWGFETVDEAGAELPATAPESVPPATAARQDADGDRTRADDPGSDAG
jgi:hypothetical protein